MTKEAHLFIVRLQQNYYNKNSKDNSQPRLPVMQPFMQYFCDDTASTNQEITTVTKLRFATHIYVLCMWKKNIAVCSVQPGTFNKLGEKIKQTLPGL